MNISIIVPVYNTEKYLKECIDSVLAQTYTDFELLLVDDGSTDKSGDICDEYAQKDSRIRVFHKKNGGASSARNVGLAKAKGEWICFVDSDDWVELHYLETLAQLKDKADVTFFTTKKTCESGDVNLLIPKACVLHGRLEVEEQLAHLKYGMPMDLFGWPHNKMFRASIIKENGVLFPEDVVFREDEIFMMTYSRYITSLEIIDTLLYNYRVVQDGLTAKGMKESDYIALSDHLLENLSFFQNETLLSRDKQRILDYRVEHVLRVFSFKNLFNVFRPFYEFVHSHKELKPYSNYRLMMRIVSFPYWLACVALFLERLSRWVWKRIN